MASEFKSVLFLGRFKKRQSLKDLLATTHALQQQGIAVMWSKAVAAAANEEAQLVSQAKVEVVDVVKNPRPDLAVVLGGDGMFVRAVNRFAPLGVRLVGINLGSLGFLTDIARDDMQEAMLELAAGKFVLESRSLLAASILKSKRKSKKTDDKNETLPENLRAMNDVVLTHGESGVLSTLRVYINDEFAFDLRADGLIIATPSGSTAYALSAGGPIINPRLQAMVLVPLCAHSLTHRPLVVPVDSRIRVETSKTTTKPMVVHIDGQTQRAFAPNDCLEIMQSSIHFTMCHPERYDYYHTLRRKLLWGE